MTLKYLLTGSTGGLGALVLDHFAAHVPRTDFAAASSRESNRAQFEARGIAFRQVNYDDRESLDTAFEGVENLFFVSSNTFDNERRQVQHGNVVDAAKQAGVKHVWYTSLAFGGLTNDSQAAVQVAHLHTEKLLKESGVPFTSIREGVYTEAFPVFLNWFPTSNTVTLPTDGPIAYTLRTELGEATARLILRGADKHLNEIVLLTAQETLTSKQIVEIINETTGREVTFRMVSPEEYVRIQSSGDIGGKTAGFFTQAASWWEGIARGELGSTHGLMEEVLGRRPTPAREAIRAILRGERDYTWHQNYAR